MIDGCLDWQANGLVRPESALAATNDYFAEQDLFGQWLEDCCDTNRDDPNMWDRSADLFASWQKYAEAAGDKVGNGRGFAENMRKRGFPSKRTPTTRGFVGVRVKAEYWQEARYSEAA
jgi:putative DNA primase/helicase